MAFLIAKLVLVTTDSEAEARGVVSLMPVNTSIGC